MENKLISHIPFLYSVDIMLIGGGLAGLPIARLFSERGKSVLLVESATFLGWEIGMFQRPWFNWLPHQAAIAQAWFPLAAETNPDQEGAYVALHMDRVKRKLEDRILATGTRLIYASRPIAIRRQGVGWEVIIANKSGRQVVQAKRIVDATETGLAGRLLAGESCRFLGGTADPVKSVRRVIEFTRVKPGWYEEQWLPEDVGAGGIVRLRQGAFDAGHVLLDIPISVVPDGRTSERDAEIEFIARTVSFNTAAYLVKHDPYFRKARLGWGAQHVLYGDDHNPLEALARGETIAKALWKDELPADECLLLNPVEPVETWKSPLDMASAAMDWRDENEFNRLRKLPSMMVKMDALPMLVKTGVLVAGGGTSGAVAAYSAGREGAQTSVLEMNGGLGGTATYGAVSYYWFGNRNAFTGEIDRRVMDWNRKLGYVRVDYLWGRKDNWNPEIRSYVYFELCNEAGVKVFLDCLLVGALCEGKRVCGAVVATPYGPRAALGSVCVDATGDGDLAVFAGARSVYGNQRDRMVMWASVGWFSAPGVYRGGNFATSLDCGDVLDYTRFLLVGRRRGADDLYDHAAYLAPRETRHVLGDVILTLDDQLLQREFPDTVSLCLSNHDTKGKSAADIVYHGILPPHLEIQVPYRAFLPQGLEGILVTGKALSCTHDALSALRMIDDLQQQGGAVGAAAAMAAAIGILPRNINVRQLQRKMMKKGLLPRRVLGDAKAGETDYAAITAALSGEERLQDLDMSVHAHKEAPDAVVQLFLAPSEKVLPVLRAAYPQSGGPRRLLLARMLLWHGDERGVCDVLAEIRRLLDEVTLLPERKGPTRYCQLYPDHGVMTEVTYLINSLAGSSYPQVVDVLADLVDRIEKTKRDYTDLSQCIWNSIESVAYVAERQPQPGMGALLRRLLALPELQYRIMSGGLEVGLVGERLAYLVIILARALARCGEKEGLLLLAAFSVDCRITLARCAVDELVTLTQFDCGNRPDAWMAVLESWPEAFPARPWTERMS